MDPARNDGPKSTNLGCAEADNYWLTAASWDTGYGPSYEIGIRRKSDGVFWLVQAAWGPMTVHKAMNAIKMMLNDGYTPAACQEVFP